MYNCLTGCEVTLYHHRFLSLGKIKTITSHETGSQILKTGLCNKLSILDCSYTYSRQRRT